MSKKILTVLDKPNLYGSERHVRDILRYKTDEFYHSMLVFDDGPLLEKINVVDVNIVRLGWLPRLNSIRRIFELSSLKECDVIHGHQPKGALWAAILGFVLKKTSIVTIHSNPRDHSLVKSNIISRLSVLIFHHLIRMLTMLLANKVIFVNEGMYERSYLNPKKKILLSNWLSPCYENYLTFNPRSAFRPDRKLKILSVGSVTRAKGFDIFFDFLDNIQAFDFEVNIAGGIDHEFLNTLNISESVQGKTNFLGYSTDLTQLYLDSDVFILFSRCETFGLVYLEAMAAALPIVCLDISPINTLVPEGNIRCNEVVKCYELLDKLLDEPQSIEEIARKNQSVAQSYSYDRAMSKMYNIYRKG